MSTIAVLWSQWTGVQCGASGVVIGVTGICRNVLGQTSGDRGHLRLADDAGETFDEEHRGNGKRLSLVPRSGSGSLAGLNAQ